MLVSHLKKLLRRHFELNARRRSHVLTIADSPPNPSAMIADMDAQDLRKWLMPEPKKIRNVYDKLACSALSMPELFADLLRIMMSDEALEHIDLDRVTVLYAKHVVKDGQDVESDAIASLEVAADDADGTRQLIVVVEHKSSHDKGTVRQMANYMRSVRERYSKDTWLLPVVLYHGRKREWTHPLGYVAITSGMPAALAREIAGKVDRQIFECMLVNVRDARVRQLSRGLRFEVVVYALDRCWDMNDADVRHMMRLCSKLDGKLRSELVRVLAIFISVVHPGYNGMTLREVSKRIARLEAEVVDREERIMHRMNPFYEDLKNEGRAEGQVEGRAAIQEEIVGNLIRLGAEDQFIVDSTGVAIESVLEMRDRLNGT